MGLRVHLGGRRHLIDRARFEFFPALLIDQGIYGPLKEKQSHAVRLIHSSGEHPLGLINDILHLSKVEAGKLELQPRPVEVDDRPMMLALVTSFLEAVNCQVLTAQDGARALDLAYSTHPDLVLRDIQMPHVDGLVALQELRSHWTGRPLPVIVLTALAMTGDRERYLAAGADDYLSKPMRLEDLAQAIGRQLERRLADGAGRCDYMKEVGQ